MRAILCYHMYISYDNMTTGPYLAFYKGKLVHRYYEDTMGTCVYVHVALQSQAYYELT